MSEKHQDECGRIYAPTTTELWVMGETLLVESELPCPLWPTISDGRDLKNPRYGAHGFGVIREQWGDSFLRIDLPEVQL